MNSEKESPVCQIAPEERVCAECKCASCGWNTNVERARKWYIRQFGLHKGKDGLRRLIIR